MHRATIITLLGIVVGVVLGEKTVHGSVIASVAAVASICSLSIYFFEKKYIGRENKKVTTSTFSLSHYIGLFCIALALSIVRTQFEEEKSNFICERSCTFQATVVTAAKEKDAYQIVSVLPESEVSTRYVQIRIPLYPKFQVGDRVTLSGVVSLPKTFIQNEGKRPFKYATYLALHNVGSEMLYPKIEIIRTVENTKNIFVYLQSLREIFVSTVSVYVDEPASSLATGMLFGDRTMSQELVQTFRVAGLSHIVVLSGFNIAILISFVLLLAVFMPLIVRVLFAFLVVIFFVLMVGAEVSVIRATLMSGVALTALLFGRAYSARQALLLSLIAIIMYEPKYLLYDVSLHLSFLATAGIIYLQEVFSILFQKVTSKTYREILITTSAAYVATLPYIMYTFGTISIYALIANMLVLPLVPVMMLVTFCVIVTAPLANFFGLIFGYVDTFLGELIILVARSVETLPFAAITVTVSFAGMSLLYVGIIIFSYFFTIQKNNETLLTKDDSIISGTISY